MTIIKKIVLSIIVIFAAYWLYQIAKLFAPLPEGQIQAAKDFSLFNQISKDLPLMQHEEALKWPSIFKDKYDLSPEQKLTMVSLDGKIYLSFILKDITADYCRQLLYFTEDVDIKIILLSGKTLIGKKVYTFGEGNSKLQSSHFKQSKFLIDTLTENIWGGMVKKVIKEAKQ